MSVEFSMTGCKLDCAQWNELLEEWAGAQKDDLYDEPCFEKDEDEPTMLVWGDGSTRGVVLSLGDGGSDVTVRFNVLASRKDWERGFEIMKRALAKGGGAIERETGETYTVAKLTRDQAHEEAVTDFVFGANSVRASVEQSNDKKALLPFSGFALPLTPADLPACTRENQAAIEGAIAQRLQRYGQAFRGHVLQMKNGAQLASWALIPTIIGKVDLVAMDWKDINVPCDRLVAVLGDRAEPLGGSYYLPELDPEKDRAILEALEKENVDPSTVQPSSANGEPEEDEQSQQSQVIKQITIFIMTQIAQHADPNKAKTLLVKKGMEEQVAENLIAAVSTALELLMNQRKQPQEVVGELTRHGMPQSMAAAMVGGITEFLAGGLDGDGETDEEEAEEEK